MSITTPDSVRQVADVAWPAAETVNADGHAPVLLVCEHASNRMPPEAGDLGCSPEDLARHIAVDIGAAALTRALATRLDARAVLCTTSRLYIDCNRTPGDPDCIPERSDGSVIPGNVGLDAAAKHARMTRVFEPFHHQVAQTLADLRRVHPKVLVLPIHTFAASMNGKERPHAAVIWSHAWPASTMIDGLRRHCEWVGDNEPYDGREILGHTFGRHATPAGLPHFAIEVRQDFLGEAEGVERWACWLADALSGVLTEMEGRMTP